MKLSHPSVQLEGYNMNKFAILAAGAAAGLVAVAAPAQAAVIVSYPSGQTITLTTLDGIDFDGTFRADLVGTGGDPNFTASFSFAVPGPGEVGIAAISIRTSAGSNVDFTGGLLNGVTPFTISNGFVDTASLSSLINSGLNTFTLNGTLNPPTGDGTGGFGGDVSFTLGVVPEPATWALFILGFGTIGAALRRRNGQISVSKAKLHFA